MTRDLRSEANDLASFSYTTGLRKLLTAQPDFSLVSPQTETCDSFIPGSGRVSDMPHEAMIELPCSCGAQCQVVMQCDDDPKELRTIPVHCWQCESKIGQVPALTARSEPARKISASSLLGCPQNSPLIRLAAIPGWFRTGAPKSSRSRSAP
jgi:hypothetical protein